MIDPRDVDVRFSWLKYMDQSPLHYVDAVQDQREETLSMRLGSGTHALLFGTPKVVVYRGGKLEKQVEGTGKNRGTFRTVTKTYTDVRNGELWELFEREHAGDCILNETELAKATSMARAISSHMHADRLLFSPGTQHEVDVRWVLKGRQCRGRFDALAPKAIPDLKTTKSADPRYFVKQAYESHWVVQGPWYADGAESAGLGWRQPYLVAVENSPPYPVTVWELPDETIEYGRRTYHGWLDRLLECEAANSWPGYSPSVQVLHLPHYARTAQGDKQ